jgi:hypothetical protein
VEEEAKMNKDLAKSFVAIFVGGIYGVALTDFSLLRIGLYWFFASYGFLFLYPFVHRDINNKKLDFQSLLYLCVYSCIFVGLSEFVLSSETFQYFRIMPSTILLASLLETFEIHDRLRVLLDVLYATPTNQDDILDH